jgi:hypothetical protein
MAKDWEDVKFFYYSLLNFIIAPLRFALTQDDGSGRMAATRMGIAS